jgi:hypothetical protein
MGWGCCTTCSDTVDEDAHYVDASSRDSPLQGFPEVDGPSFPKEAASSSSSSRGGGSSSGSGIGASSSGGADVRSGGGGKSAKSAVGFSQRSSQLSWRSKRQPTQELPPEVKTDYLANQAALLEKPLAAYGDSYAVVD